MEIAPEHANPLEILANGVDSLEIAVEFGQIVDDLLDSLTADIRTVKDEKRSLQNVPEHVFTCAACSMRLSRSFS